MLNAKLKALALGIADKNLQMKVVELLEDPTAEIGGIKFSGLPLGTAPAGLSHHHSYPGGYVEHVVSAAKIASSLCDSVEKVYHGKVNRDIVLAGILLHDLFKPLTYSITKDGVYESTPLADLLDHLSLATAELVRRGFPLNLVHAVTAHLGNYGPIRPRTVEALICHIADMADARLNGEVINAASYLARRASGQEFSRLYPKEAFAIVHAKSIKGWEGVSKTVEKILEKRRPRKT